MLYCIDCPFHISENKECLFQKRHVPLNPFSFKKGEVVFSENQSLSGVFCIKEGTAVILKTCSNGKDQIIELLSRGTLLGIRSLLSNDKTNLQAKSLTPISGCFLAKEDFFLLLANDPDFSLFICTQLASYIKKSDDRIVTIGQKSMRQRVAEILLELPIYFKTQNNGFVDVKLRREDLANMIGIASESLIRTLSFFREQTWIELKGKQIKIINSKKLEQFSQGHYV